MEISQEKKEIKKLSRFLSEMYVPHYVDGTILYVLGECIYVNFDEPMELWIMQNDVTSVRIIKDSKIIYIEVWRGLDGVTYNIEMSNVKIIFNNGQLEIRFMGD